MQVLKHTESCQEQDKKQEHYGVAMEVLQRLRIDTAASASSSHSAEQVLSLPKFRALTMGSDGRLVKLYACIVSSDQRGVEHIHEEIRMSTVWAGETYLSMQAEHDKADISYIALEVSEQADEKLVRMVSISSRREVTAHLRDGWYSQTLHEFFTLCRNPLYHHKIHFSCRTRFQAWVTESILQD